MDVISLTSEVSTKLGQAHNASSVVLAREGAVTIGIAALYHKAR